MTYKRVFSQAIFALVLIICCMFLFSGNMALAKKSPYNATKDYIDEVMQKFLDSDVCSKEKMTTEKKQALRDDLSQMADKIFDFEYMCRKAVGPYWRAFTDEQRKRAVSLFTELLENNYFGKLLEHMEEIQDLCRENFRVTGQEMLSSNKAVVHSFIVYRDKKYPVDYIMRDDDGEWQIYNVDIEGVSFLDNYSSQFRDMLGRKKPEVFLEKLENKVEQNK